MQEVKDINSAKAALNSATANKIQASLDNVFAIQRLCEEAGDDMDRILVLLQANQQTEIRAVIEGKWSGIISRTLIGRTSCQSVPGVPLSC